MEEPVELIAPDVPVIEPVVPEVPIEPITPPVSAHPLQPGGQRFEQVYARSKQAERDLEAERERRIAAEAKLEVLNKGTSTAAKEYEWDELDAMIASGQITRADANRHREEVMSKRLIDKLQVAYQRESYNTVRINALNKTFSDYLAAVPGIQDQTNAQRQRVDQEFDWLVSVQGKDVKNLDPIERKAFEVTALRNVLGPVESLTKRLTPVTETHQGSTGGVRPSGTGNPDQKLIDELSPRQVDHYNRMMKSGKYPGGWKDVVDELKFVPPGRR